MASLNQKRNFVTASFISLKLSLLRAMGAADGKPPPPVSGRLAFVLAPWEEIPS